MTLAPEGVGLQGFECLHDSTSCAFSRWNARKAAVSARCMSLRALAAICG